MVLVVGVRGGGVVMEMVVIKLYRQFSTPTQDEIALNPIQLTLPRLIFSSFKLQNSLVLVCEDDLST